jgi:hypothetical protein
MQVVTFGRDLAKNVFQIHGVDAAGHTIVEKQLKRLACPLLCQFSASDDWRASLLRRALLDTQAARHGPQRQAYGTAVCQTLRLGQQKRCQRCRGDLRGRRTQIHALCTDQECGAVSTAESASRAAGISC